MWPYPNSQWNKRLVCCESDESCDNKSLPLGKGHGFLISGTFYFRFPHHPHLHLMKYWEMFLNFPQLARPWRFRSRLFFSRLPPTPSLPPLAEFEYGKHQIDIVPFRSAKLTSNAAVAYDVTIIRNICRIILNLFFFTVSVNTSITNSWFYNWQGKKILLKSLVSMVLNLKAGMLVFLWSLWQVRTQPRV